MYFLDSDFTEWRSGNPSFDESKFDPKILYVPCFSSMAMGDHNAVEFEQGAHFIIMCQSTAIVDNEIVTFSSRAPKTPVFGGVIQDDTAIFELQDAVWDADRKKYLPSVSDNSLLQANAMRKKLNI